MATNNFSVLKHISHYCKDIDNCIIRFGNQEDVFINDIDYQNSICMSILQIGELTTHLSEDFKKINNKDIDWRALKYIRNICAHRYGTVDLKEIWNVALNDIPKIQLFCNQQIQMDEILNQDAIEPEYDDDEIEL